MTCNYRDFITGEVIDGSISEDDLNFYLHGVVDDSIPGIFSNYVVIPKFAAVKI